MNNLTDIISQLDSIDEALTGITISLDMYDQLKNQETAKIFAPRLVDHLYNHIQFLQNALKGCNNKLVEIDNKTNSIYRKEINS